MKIEDMKKHGVFSWSELMTTDPEAAKAFYQKLFGWNWEEHKMENSSYWVIQNDGEGVGGIMGIPRDAQGMPPSWGVYVTVGNVDAISQQVEELGGKVLVPPQDIPNIGRFAVIQDPQGAVLSVITYVNS